MPNPPEKRQNVYKCSVVGCTNARKVCRGQTSTIKFYSFPNSYAWQKERNMIWIKFTKRKNDDGSDWVPNRYSVVCSAQFVDNVKSRDPSSLNYNPTVEPVIPSTRDGKLSRLKNKLAKRLEAIRKRTRCSVSGCDNSRENCRDVIPGIKFYTFPHYCQQPDRRDAWIKFSKRINADGSEWVPRRRALMCSVHFIGNSKSENPNNSKFNPTIYKQSPLEPLKKEASSLGINKGFHQKEIGTVERYRGTGNDQLQNPESEIVPDGTRSVQLQPSTIKMEPDVDLESMGVDEKDVSSYLLVQLQMKKEPLNDDKSVFDEKGNLQCPPVSVKLEAASDWVETSDWSENDRAKLDLLATIKEQVTIDGISCNVKLGNVT